MRIAIISCETFKRELEMLTSTDPDIVHREYLEFGLHEHPQELRRVVVEKVQALQGEVDAVFLAYGVCQSLNGVVDELQVPTVTLEADDCIGVLLTPEGYEAEKKKCTGTFFATPYFSEMGVEWFERDLRKKLGDRAAEFDVMWFLEKMFDGYSRCLFIDTGIEGKEHFESLAQRFAEQLELRFDATVGTLELLRDGLARTKGLACKQ
jgi:hypothetical protein